MTTINPNYALANQVLTRFDGESRPGAPLELAKTIFNDEGLPLELQAKIIGFASTQRFETGSFMPEPVDGEPQEEIVDFTHVKDWAHLTGLLHMREENAHLGPNVADESALRILSQLGIERNRQYASSEQLWRVIFNGALEESDLAGRVELVQLAANVDIDELEQNFSNWEVRYYRTTKLVGQAVGNRIVRLVTCGILLYFGYVYSYRALAFAKHQIHLLDAGFMNGLTSRIYRIAVGAIAITWLASYPVQWSGLISTETGQRLRSPQRMLTSLLMLPRVLISGIVSRGANEAYRKQGALAESLNNYADVRTEMAMRRGTAMAQEAWMALYQEAMERGIPYQVPTL